MFGDATRPFYQSTEMMYLGEIPADIYTFFIIKLFTKNSRQVEANIIAELLRWCRGHTWYVQYVGNKLFETGHDINNRNPQG